MVTFLFIFHAASCRLGSTNFGTQVIKKKWPVWPVFPDYLSVSCDHALIKNLSIFNKHSCVAGSDVDFM